MAEMFDSKFQSCDRSKRVKEMITVTFEVVGLILGLSELGRVSPSDLVWALNVSMMVSRTCIMTSASLDLHYIRSNKGKSISAKVFFSVSRLELETFN